MREAEFLNELYALLDAQVVGLDPDEKLRIVRDVCEAARLAKESGRALSCHVVPFTTGRRPTDEAAHPGLGSSDNTAMILPPGETRSNRAYVLYTLSGLDGRSPEELRNVALDLTLSLAGSDGSLTTTPLPGWSRRPLAPAVFETTAAGDPVVKQIALPEAAGRRLVVAISPDDLLPGAWRWEEADPQIRAAATDEEDPFTFGHMATQMVHVQVRATERGVPVTSAHAWIDVCDTRRVGSLYKRILDRLVVPDTERQAAAVGQPSPGVAYHPWYPVLHIGSDKASLYMRALVEDVVHKKRHLTDARWLMRVGLYLELLTCLAVVEVVKDDVGDLLTPAERRAFETSPLFAEIRRRIDIRAWREVWALREVSFPAFGVQEGGLATALGLLQKKKATLAFLEAHHQDLKHAIELAGPNIHNAQETWHRVFRDAERAVLRKTPEAFPELSHFPEPVRAFLLWHRRGHVDVRGLKWLSKQFSTLFGDQDGLFASACNQYRTSMNEVAEWAKKRSLMDYTGEECVPPEVSILQAYMSGRSGLLARLQQRDGYAGRLEVEVEAELPDDLKLPTEDVKALMAEAPLFQALSDDERARLAAAARLIALGPMERIMIEGREGSSLFLVAEGRLEALVRQADGTDLLVDVNKRGDVVGEISFLTGTPRTATVRAAEGAVVYEIGKSQFEEVVRARPQLVEELATMMKGHVENATKHRARYESFPETGTFGKRLRRLFLADESGPVEPGT